MEATTKSALLLPTVIVPLLSCVFEAVVLVIFDDIELKPLLVL